MPTLAVVESPAKCGTIQRHLGRDYLVRASLGHLRDLAATPLGDRAVAWLMRHFPELLDYSFTADLERQLDEIAAGSRGWTAVLDAFHRRLLAQVESASA